MTTPTVIVFPGQGAQAVGMGRDVAEAYPECGARLRAAGEVLGRDLARICFEGPLEALTRSDNCQPAIFAVSVAFYMALLREAPGTAFVAAAGLSLGEWSALHAAGALSFEDGVRILDARGRFMQEACERQPGAMVSVIGLSIERVGEIAAAAGVEIANLNADDQTVLSGHREGIERAEKAANEAGAKRTVVLNVAGAFHSSLMAPAAARLSEMLVGIPFRAPSFPVVSNVSGRPHGGPEDIRRDMVRQITSPVQWVSTVRWLREAGVRQYVECGPGRVLSGLIKRVDKDAVTHNIQDVSTLKKTAAALRGPAPAGG
jgi:[acyl-carrier-protein] S-malonyltransferase